MKRFFLALATCAMLATPASAQSVAGEWDAAMNTPGGVRTFKVLLEVNGNKVTGTVKRQAGDVPLVGTIKGDTLNFSYTINYNENALVLTVIATVRGDSLQGIVDFAGAAQEEFSAQRVAGTARTPPPAPPAAAAARSDTPGGSLDHSERSATVGSSAAARRAGIQHAATAMTAKSAVITA